jgi:hypothetical protein
MQHDARIVNTDGYRVANSTPGNPQLEPPGLEMRIPLE